MNKTIKNYFSLIKFSHTVFALPFAFVGFTYGIKSGYQFEWHKFVYVLLCMVFARTAAMAFNRLIDRKFDALNPRTKNREIPSGIISTKSAFWFVIINSTLFIVTTWFINLICFYLSFVALSIILGYSYTKRFTPLCHLVLGVGLALAPIGAYLAVTGVFDAIPVLFGFLVFFWVSGFDIIYALQDMEFDVSNQLRSIPSYLGLSKALVISRILHFICAIIIIFIGIKADFSIIYWTGAILFCGLLLYQHTLVKASDLSKINIAFATTNGIGSLVFSFFVVMDIIIISC
jgi:4-hydroxybenzoate polyprenyltransferase